MDYLEHKGYKGTIECSTEDGSLFGKVLNTGKDLICYEGEDLDELRADFEAAVDGYIKAFLFDAKSEIDFYIDRWIDEFIKNDDDSFSPSPLDNYEFNKFVCKKLKVTNLNKDITNLLLSAVRKSIANKLDLEVNIGGNSIMAIVQSAMERQFDLEQKRWKRGDSGDWDLMWLFKHADKTIRNYDSGKCKTGHAYLRLKRIELAVLKIRHEFVQEEENQRRRLREEEKALRELKREKEQAERDAEKARAAIEKNQAALINAKTAKQIEKLQAQIAELELALQRAEERRERALSMAQQTRCGYVYVISNVGSFGEGVYKIGLTRRLNPMDRVAELGDASVPFPFDVHAMIYSEDAPGLEAHLHRVFHRCKVNTANWRKEYFRVSLQEIRKEVENQGIVCEWVEKPAAQQWRISNKNSDDHQSYEYNPFEEW